MSQKLNYGDLSVIISNIVYDEACDLEMTEIDELIEYLDKHENNCILMLED